MSIRIEENTVTPALERIRDGLRNTREVNRAAAEGILPKVQGSLRHMAQTNHNAFGVRSTFWNQQLAATVAGVDDQGGYVSMPSPVHLRALGGTVTPTQSKYLAIPARSEAYGKSPKDFSDLRFVMLPNGKAMLVQNQLQPGQKTRGKKIDGQGRRSIAPREPGDGVFYWLVPEATIAADPEVLPTNAEMEAGAARGIKDYLATAAKGSA